MRLVDRPENIGGLMRPVFWGSSHAGQKAAPAILSHAHSGQGIQQPAGCQVVGSDLMRV